MRNWFRQKFAPSGRQPGQAATHVPEVPEVPVVPARPLDATLSMEDANLAFDQRDFATAAVTYRTVLAAAPANTPVLRKLGFALKELGQLQEAELMLTRSLEFDTASADTYYFLGEIAAAQGNLDVACNNWRAAISLAPDFEPAYLGLCRLLYQDGWLDIALQVVTDGIAHIPGSADLYFCLGNLYQGRQQFDLAEQAYRHASEIQPGRADILANLASALTAQHRYDEAIDIMRHSIDLEPNRADVRNNLANALCRVGRFDEALVSFRSAVAMVPGYAEGWNDWGMTLHKLNRSAEAIECFKQFLQQDPAHVATLFNLANVLQVTRQWADAAQYYSRILELAPDRVEVLYNLGVTLATAGDHAAAEACYRRVLVLQPQNADANFSLGVLLHTQGKLDDAIALYMTAIPVRPEHVQARFNLAAVYRRQEKWLEAATEYAHILRIKPDHVEALCDWGVTCQARGLHDEAILHYRQALAIDSASHNVLVNLGTALEETGQLGAALACCEQALHIKADSLEARINMASIFSQQGRLEEAVALCEQVLAIKPDHPDAHYSRGLSLLRLGRYEDGWKEYEYRWARADAPPKPDFPADEWLGDRNLQGKTILLYTEQGLGDTIQFARYAELVASRGAKIILEVQAPLLPLMKDMKDIDQFVVRGQTDALPAFDFQCSLLSLPAAFHSALATIPARSPYLQAPSDRVTHWKTRLADHKAPKIGLVWSGNPLHKNDRNRSTALSTLAPLWSQGRWTFLSLQKDVRAEDAALLQETASITDLSAHLTDFAETAAIISGLDLVITIDSSLAHLTGALGVPVWIMLPYLPDFRWLMERQDSPWYPSARLFRQTSAGDWSAVIHAIDEALAAQFGMRQH